MLGGAYIPKTSKVYSKAKKYLTLSVFNVGEQESADHAAYVQGRRGITIPRDYARKLGVDPNHVSYGTYLKKNLLKPVKLKPEQEPFVDSLEYLATSVYDDNQHPFIDIRAEAATGKGKTVMALELCRRLQVTTLIVVDQEFLRDQWIDRATELFKVPRTEIGIVQGKKIEWKGKSIVVGMLQSLYAKEMPEEFWQYFGFAVFDESHTVGAKNYSNILMRVPASIRLAVSATSDRGDELDTLLDAHLGKVQVYLQGKHKASEVRYVTYSGNTYSWYANSSPKAGRYITEIASDGRRNMFLAKVIMALYDEGHYVLAVTDRVEHAEDIGTLLGLMGVPKEEIGLVCGFSTAFRIAKDNSPLRRPEGYVRGTPYTPVKLQRIRKRVNNASLNHAKNNARIVLATYGKFEKGVDVPHLSAGVDMTPRKKAVQVHGRILREHEGKLGSVWVTVRDDTSYRAEHQFASRITEYVKSNAEVYKWRLGKNPQPVEANRLSSEAKLNALRLKGGKITTKRDGNYTVTMNPIERKSSYRPAQPTGKITRKALTH